MIEFYCSEKKSEGNMKKIISVLFVLTMLTTVHSQAASLQYNLSVGLQSSKTTSAVTKTTAYRAVGLSQLNSTHRVQIVRNGSQNVGGPYNVVYGEIYVFKNLNINAGDRVSLRVFNDEAYNRTLSGKFEADHAGD